MENTAYQLDLNGDSHSTSVSHVQGEEGRSPV